MAGFLGDNVGALVNGVVKEDVAALCFLIYILTYLLLEIHLFKNYKV